MDVVSDAISAVRIGRPSSHRARVAGTWCSRLPAYDGAGFHVVLEGSCWLLPDSGSAVSLGTGDVVLLPHGAGHVLADAPADRHAVERAVPFERWLDGHGLRMATSAPPADAPGATELLCGKYRLDRSHTHPLMTELPDVIHLPNRIGRYPELRAAIDLLGCEIGAARPGTGVVVPGLLDLLLVYMVRAWMADGTADGSAGWPAALNDPVVAEALRVLHEDPALPWSNDRLAAQVGVSRATLARRFTALVGRPPMAYLGWWRVTRAAAMLRDTQEPLDTIARRVGYSSPYALSHAFSRLLGTTPGRYRTRTSQ
ncbi:AraC family transcriptional regulator [Streptomyces sp. NBC_01142]|uniref:AraC family transcriptional regulator n=1 Tax=Streptomyces sp. NBC_01142 TaxID=2975865 RepID=UPI002251CD3B|nr:AraC family transcriptional regulator [Streptomyces sp. NBC_01142]MCX4823904.1 AraC family transcriptional regulator [Streptomyces sp. NBC_01142]